MSLATVFGATAAVLGATAVVHAANVQLTVRKRRRERAARRRPRRSPRVHHGMELSAPLRVLVDDAMTLASRLDHARLAGDVAWAKAVVARGDRQWTTPDPPAEDAPYMAAVGDALRATSSFLAGLGALPSADAELVSDRTLLADALEPLLDAGRSPLPPRAGRKTDAPITITPEDIDALEQLLDTAIAALDRVVYTLAVGERRPYR
jgi:hypothetical protein